LGLHRQHIRLGRGGTALGVVPLALVQCKYTRGGEVGGDTEGWGRDERDGKRGPGDAAVDRTGRGPETGLRYQREVWGGGGYLCVE